MKKEYICPAVAVESVECQKMMALSLQDGNADGSPVLSREMNDWDIWSEEDDAE